MKKKIIFNLVSLIGIALSVVFILINWNVLPDRFPIHFSISGEPDNFAGKWAVWLSPIISAAIYFLMQLMISKPWMVSNYPYKITPETKEKHYNIIRDTGYYLRVGIIWVFTYIQWWVIEFAKGNKSISGFTILIPIAIVITVAFLSYRRGKKVN